MRPKPLMPTRTVMLAISLQRRFSGPREVGPTLTLTESRACVSARMGHWFYAGPTGLVGPAPLVPMNFRAFALVVVEQIRGKARLGVRDAQLGGALVGRRQQAPDAAGHRVLGQLRVVQLTEFLQTCLLVLHPQYAG